MKVITWNVNGIRAREAQALKLVQDEQPDVLCLQEVKASPEQVPASLCELPGYWCYWHGHKGYSGVGLHLKKATFPEKPPFAHPDFDDEHRIVTAQIGNLHFASIYVPNGGKDFPAKVRFMEAMDRFIADATARGITLCWCGDLNVARLLVDVHPSMRKPDSIGQTPGERAIFERWLSHGLTDLHRKFVPDDDRLYTWWAPWRNMKQKNVGWRLDYVLTSPELTARASSCKVVREFGTSDHGPVIAEFA
ncbi:MAG: exodeoxyribonuclease III [Myxococcaceae bacterium]